FVGPAGERAHDRPLVARGEVGAAAPQLLRRQLAHHVQQCGLQSREREVEPGNTCDRKGVRGRVALAREPVDRGAAGIAEPEQPCALVECLTRRVVERRPEHATRDRKSTRLNSSHGSISYAVFCLNKKKRSVQIDGPEEVAPAAPRLMLCGYE